LLSASAERVCLFVEVVLRFLSGAVAGILAATTIPGIKG
jgi:hypothetical protein